MITFTIRNLEITGHTPRLPDPNEEMTIRQLPRHLHVVCRLALLSPIKVRQVGSTQHRPFHAPNATGGRPPPTAPAATPPTIHTVMQPPENRLVVGARNREDINIDWDASAGLRRFLAGLTPPWLREIPRNPTRSVTPQTQTEAGNSTEQQAANSVTEANVPSVSAAYEPRYRYSVLAIDSEDRGELKEALEEASRNSDVPIEFEVDGKKGQIHVSHLPPAVQETIADLQLLSAFSKEFKACLKRLETDAAAYCANVVLPPRPALPEFDGTENQKQVIAKMLQASDGFTVGEAHRSIASKKFLIENMGELAQQGVKVLYMEHLCSDRHQSRLDEYAKSSPGSPMPKLLKSYLDDQDQGHMRPPVAIDREETKRYRDLAEKYNFTQVVAAAQAAAIKIVAIDCDTSYNTELYDKSLDPKQNQSNLLRRYKSMNYLAAKRINSEEKREDGEKWIAFVGSGHANTNLDVPGVAELTGTLSLIVDDDKEPDEPALRTKVKQYNNDLNPDVVLTLDTYKKTDSQPHSSQSTAVSTAD